jgi:predicted RNase H-like nuclease (RuvC/YqgF family)
MRLRTVFCFSAILALSAIGVAAQDQSSSDDVAAAARKAREQQKSAPAPKKVITNDDIPAAKNAAPAAADSSASKEETPQVGADDKAAGTDSKEASWRKRFQDQHDKIAAAEKELDILQRELDKDQVQYYSDPQKALMQQHDRSDINEKTAKIDAKKKEIETLKQELSDMEDDLRKEGGDPGWAR